MDFNYLEQRLLTKKEQLDKQQKSFMIYTKAIKDDSFEDNAINNLLEMKRLKTEIKELETNLQFLKVNNL